MKFLVQVACYRVCGVAWHLVGWQLNLSIDLNRYLINYLIYTLILLSCTNKVLLIYKVIN